MIRTALQIMALLLGIGVAQSIATQLWRPLGLVDGLMIASGLLALRLPFPGAVFSGAFAGFLQDSLAGGLIGLHAFAKTAASALIASLGSVLMVRGPLAEALVIGVAALVESVIVRTLLSFLDWPGAEGASRVLGRGLATALLCGTLLVAGPRMGKRWHRWRSRSRSRSIIR